MHSGTLLSQVSERERKHSELARKLAAEAIVLLKNDGLLPLKLSDPVALLGCGAPKTVKGGIGSGDVNNRHSVSIYQGMKECGANLLSEKWLQEYDACYDAARVLWKEKILEAAKHVENPFDAYASNPFVLPTGRKVTEDDIQGAKAAVYVISRISGEGKDRRAVEGDYFLNKEEKEDLLFLVAHQIPTVLVINAGGAIELTDLLEQAHCIQAVLNISQLGQEGGHAVADVLYGKAMPEGRLTATWARRYSDYPYSAEYSYLNGNLQTEYYREGIFVGYRYFDSFGVEPLFPFGFGLSYTSFSIQYESLRVAKNGIEIDVKVTNEGETYAGREVVQIYASLPATGTQKETHRLIGFGKTGVIAPKESEKLTIYAEQKQLAEFSEEQSAWIIEKGLYGIWVGEHSASLTLCAALEVKGDNIIEKTNSIFKKEEELEELILVNVKSKEQEQVELACQKHTVTVYEFVPVEEEKRARREIPSVDIPAEELIPLLYGNITQGTSTLGSAGRRVPGSAGESSEALEEKYNIRSLIMADGPAGIRLRQSYEVNREDDSVYGMGVLGSLENGYLEPMVYHENADLYYQYCTAFPVGTALAQTWDPKLLEIFGEAVAEEMREFHVDLWLAPGMNIHRNPLCGRNFEYFSEDPLVSGIMAAAVTRGVQKKGDCGVTIKHFAGNNQEDNRMGVNDCISERTLREIYLRGFEIAVKSADPYSIMTSYNLINGVHAANSKDLCTTLAREEWGFDGVIMSDWNTTTPDGGSTSWKCAAAGNDIIMPGNPEDDKNIREALKDGLLSEKEIRDCAERVIALVKKIEAC